MKAVNAILKRFGSSRIKQHIWDEEFVAGKWDYMDGQASDFSQQRDVVLDVVDKYSTGGDILDLGCGIGRTGFEIASVYRSYVGVDISEVAVQKAKAILENDVARAKQNRYLVADIAKFVPDRLFQVILFRESVYYFSIRVVPKIFRRYANYATPNGVIILRLHDRGKYERIVEHVETNYRVLERRLQDGGNGIVIAFAPQKPKKIVGIASSTEKGRPSHARCR